MKYLADRFIYDDKLVLPPAYFAPSAVCGQKQLAARREAFSSTKTTRSRQVRRIIYLPKERLKKAANFCETERDKLGWYSR
jgi:hypothetical protein